MSIATLLTYIVDRLYFKLLSRVISRDTFGYGLCGAANIALDTMWYFVIYHYIIQEHNVDLGIVVISPHIAALGIVFPITFFTGFMLNRYVAFRVTNYPHGRQLVRYALSVVGSIVLNYVLMKLLVDLFGFWPTVSKMLTTVIVALYSFLVARYYTFIHMSDN